MAPNYALPEILYTLHYELLRKVPTMKFIRLKNILKAYIELPQSFPQDLLSVTRMRFRDALEYGQDSIK